MKEGFKAFEDPVYVTNEGVTNEERVDWSKVPDKATVKAEEGIKIKSFDTYQNANEDAPGASSTSSSPNIDTESGLVVESMGVGQYFTNEGNEVLVNHREMSPKALVSADMSFEIETSDTYQDISQHAPEATFTSNVHEADGMRSDFEMNNDSEISGWGAVDYLKNRVSGVKRVAHKLSDVVKDSAAYLSRPFMPIVRGVKKINETLFFHSKHGEVSDDLVAAQFREDKQAGKYEKAKSQFQIADAEVIILKEALVRAQQEKDASQFMLPKAAEKLERKIRGLKRELLSAQEWRDEKLKIAETQRSKVVNLENKKISISKQLCELIDTHIAPHKETFTHLSKEKEDLEKEIESWSDLVQVCKNKHKTIVDKIGDSPQLKKRFKVQLKELLAELESAQTELGQRKNTLAVTDTKLKNVQQKIEKWDAKKNVYKAYTTDRISATAPIARSIFGSADTNSINPSRTSEYRSDEEADEIEVERNPEVELGTLITEWNALHARTLRLSVDTLMAHFPNAISLPSDAKITALSFQALVINYVTSKDFLKIHKKIPEKDIKKMITSLVTRINSKG